MQTPELTEVADGLRFPEGPVWCSDGSLLVVEIAAGVITRIAADGEKTTVAETGGGPNGLAVGPDGAVYVCQNGGCFGWIDLGGLTLPGGPLPDSWSGGSIQRVDLDTGEVTTLYTECDGHPLRAPNDLVFDDTGHLWFTDHGVRDHERRTSDLTGTYHAAADGSSITEALFPLEAPNGVGLSPSGDRVYVSETHTSRLWAWDLEAPGRPVPSGAGLGHQGEMLGSPAGQKLFDSLAVDGDGNVVVGTLGTGGLTIYSPEGDEDFLALPDPLVTNVCFGGEDLRTAYATLSAQGKVVSFRWPYPGLELAYSV